MGILLTASEDSLLSDKLKDDPLKQENEYDPVGVEEGNRVRIYDKDMKMAMHPEEKESALNFKSEVDDKVAEQTGILNQYKSDWAESMAKADAAAQAQIAKAKSQRPTVSAAKQEKVTVNVSSNGNHEASYIVNKEWADQALGGNYNIDVEGYGKEVHQALQSAMKQTHDVDKERAQSISDAQATADQAHAMSIQGLEEQVASQRQIATNEYNQNVDLYNQQISETQQVWINWLNKNQQAFIDGVKNNDKGITNLLNSGALEFKGTAK